jgi:hypothetical protein
MHGYLLLLWNLQGRRKISTGIEPVLRLHFEKHTRLLPVVQSGKIHGGLRCFPVRD